MKKGSSSHKTVLICHGTGCVSSKAPAVHKALEAAIKKNKLTNVCVKLTGCHGFCQRGPIMIIEPEGIFYSQVSDNDMTEIVQSHLKNNHPVERLFYKDPQTGEPIPQYRDIPFYKQQARSVVLRNCGHINPEEIKEYQDVGGFKALEKLLSGMSPEHVIDEIKKSGLRGRGGAGFPTGKKWEFCHHASGDKKYMICNADEGDPGAFMDRSILEADPQSVIEGLIIAGYAIGAHEGFIYVRAEYPLAVKRIRIALQQAEGKGFLGKNILGSTFCFTVHVMEGAGAFVCGEETALIASIEGRYGRPRPRPPYPAHKGLWDCPTTINNVKTLASVPVIIEKGAEWFSRIGSENCHGTAVFALTGHIANCGLVEVAMGTKLRQIIDDIGGGVPDGKAFKAVQTGGPSGGCLPARFLDYTVDYESLAKVGSIMGSGGMVVMNEDTCMVDFARYFLDFTQKESCGKCLPCRLGTKQMLVILDDIVQGKGRLEDIDFLVELGEAVKKGSLCGLGQTAPNPVLTTIRYFRDEYEAHIKRNSCPAVVCKEIISSPCQHTCPIDTEAATYISFIARKHHKEAFEVIAKDNPLPSVCSRVCHHPCEAKCQAGKWDQPIAIRALKRFVTDYAIERGLYPKRSTRKPKGQKVAIIGSGPAGLMAGYKLALKGYEVTIYEAMPVAGGGLAVYIPEYRLPKSALRTDLTNIRKAGVTIMTGTCIGKDLSFKDLLKKHKAVFIATGAHKSKKMNIPNENAKGVIDAIEFLKEANLKNKLQLGKKIGIIGGGNAAVDAARVATRLKGTTEVTILYRRTRKEMPAFKEEVDAALAEGIAIKFLTAPNKVVVKNRRLAGVECLAMRLGDIDASGRRRPVPVEGSEFVVDVDTLLVAIGESADVSFLGEDHGMNISKWGTIEANPETLATNVKGVFAGGDVVTGPNTAIEAMAHGKIAAQQIDNYLTGEDIKRNYPVTRPSMYVRPVTLTDAELEQAKRPVIPSILVSQRAKNFKEVDMNLTEKNAIKEARRCLRCDLETEDAKQCLERRKAREAVTCG
jgi:NADH-quinone oxidoreductase subunit F